MIDERRLEGVTVRDMPGATLHQVRTAAQQHKRRHGLPMLVVDLAGRVRPPPGRRFEREHEELTAISRGLQELSGKLRTHLIACVQVNRAVFLNTDKRPGLEHLKGSGSWEEDADHVIFIHRLALMGVKNDFRTEIIFAKDRIAGNTGSVFLVYNVNTGQYEPAERQGE